MGVAAEPFYPDTCCYHNDYSRSLDLAVRHSLRNEQHLNCWACRAGKMAYREVTYRKPMCASVMGVAEVWHQDKYISHNDYTASDSFTVTVEQRMPEVHSL